MPASTLNNGLRLLTSARTLVTFLAGGVTVGVMGNAVYQLLTEALAGQFHPKAAVIFALAMLVFWLLVGLFGRFAREFRVRSPLPEKASPAQRRGLILLVSNEPTQRRALKWHERQMEYCWLLCSEQTMPLATQLRQELTEARRVVHIELIRDVFDPLACYEAVNRIYTSLPAGLSEKDVILDFTGMTAVASVGAVLACLDEQRPIQYTPGVYNQNLQEPVPGNPIEIVLNWGVIQQEPQPQTSPAPETLRR